MTDTNLSGIEKTEDNETKTSLRFFCSREGREKAVMPFSLRAEN